MWTPLCDLLRIDHPIIQSGMGRIAGPDLVAQVCRAGGLGILAGLGLSGEELRRQIRRVRELTDRPFGVNLWLHEELRPPVLPDRLPPERIRRVQDVLNTFRDRFGLPIASAPPSPFPDVIDEAFDAIVEERVPVWSIGLGNPSPAMVERCRAAGILVMAMVAAVEDARAVSGAGVDVIVAQGGEAGGHRSAWRRPASPRDVPVGTMTLVPQVVDAVPQPVIAAGGIADGRGVAAALALGAQGVMLGTRFVATRESMAPPMVKEALVAAGAGDTTITEAFTGLPARALRNRFVDAYEASGAPVLPGLLQSKAAEDIFLAAARSGDREYFPMMAGQSAGLIADLPSAGDVVRALVAEAAAAAAKISG